MPVTVIVGTSTVSISRRRSEEKMAFPEGRM